MPASYVHQSVAAHAADALSLQDSAAERSALLAGAEGPDPMFFCFRPANRLRRWSVRCCTRKRRTTFCSLCAKPVQATRCFAPTAAAFSRIMPRIRPFTHLSMRIP